jgi:hypothetical protein
MEKKLEKKISIFLTILDMHYMIGLIHYFVVNLIQNGLNK